MAVVSCQSLFLGKKKASLADHSTSAPCTHAHSCAYIHNITPPPSPLPPSLPTRTHPVQGGESGVCDLRHARYENPDGRADCRAGGGSCAKQRPHVCSPTCTRLSRKCVAMLRSFSSLTRHTIATPPLVCPLHLAYTTKGCRFGPLQRGGGEARALGEEADLHDGAQRDRA